jgi:hypothetical protein
MPELTVVMAVFNGERFLPAALDSIMGQSMRDFELIIVNDGSTDGSAEILDEYARRSGRIQVVHERHAGTSAAVNLGCARVRTPYIARMDADDVSLPDRVARQLRFLRGCPQVALLGGGAEFINGSGEVLFRVDVPTRHEEIAAMLPERNVFVHSAVVMRRDAFLAVGGYRRAFSGLTEDYDLWLRIAEQYEVANLAEVIVRYRVHRGQVTTTRLREQTRAAIGARLSARLRQSGQDDPFDAMESVSDDTLNRLGVSMSEIEHEAAKAAGSWARLTGEAGDHDTAVVLARQAWQGGRGRVVTRHEVGRHYLAAAHASLARGHLAHGLSAAARAVIWQPALLGRMLRGGLGAITRRLRGREPQREK